MNKKLNKFLKYLLITLILSLTVSFSYLYIPKTLESFDNRLRDYMFILRGEEPHSDNVVVIDIDDKSIEQIGQWPWSRDVVSEMLINLTNAEVGLIAFDIVFAFIVTLACSLI